MSDLVIPKLVLDPNNDQFLITQFIERAKSASGGLLTDDSPGSVLAALAEGQVFSVAELLYYLNMLPEALALEVLRLSGVTRSPGTAAKGSLTILLSARLSTNFVINQGTVIPYSPTGFKGTGATGFILTSTLTIPAGSLEGSVPIQATQVGSAFNLPRFGVAIGNPGFNYAQSIYNPEALTGGSDLEPLDQLIFRAQYALRSRSVLVSIVDYAQKARELYGGGTAKVVPFLSADRETLATGQVHVFLVSDNLAVPNVENCQSIQSQLQELSFAASKVWVSPVKLTPVSVEVTVQGIIGLANVAAIESAIREYLNPMNLGVGEDIRIKRLEFVVQNVQGVDELTSCLINNEPLNVPMPNGYTCPAVDQLVITITDSTKASQTYFRGTGQGDPD